MEQMVDRVLDHLHSIGAIVIKREKSGNCVTLQSELNFIDDSGSEEKFYRYDAISPGGTSTGLMPFF